MTQEEKLQRLLEMQEHPERYTEEEIRQLMTDEECRQLYEQMVRATDAIFGEKAKVKNNHFSLKKLAAVFISIMLLSGIAYATYNLAIGGKKESAIQETRFAEPRQQQPVKTGGNVMVFNNVQLDSVLAVVAQHYDKQVVFRNDTLHTLHFHIEWNKAASLNDFIMLINNFEGISIREENDTIIAE